jgi:hypothetical protein
MNAGLNDAAVKTMIVIGSLLMEQGAKVVSTAVSESNDAGNDEK